MRVIVLGCGPAGLMATHAAAMAGCDILIYSKARQSHMRGAQYLHRPIPGVTPPDSRFTIKYDLLGTPQSYRDKVYGPSSQVTVAETSASLMEGHHDAWDIRVAYDNLWEMYGPFVQDADLTTEGADSLITWAKADLVVSTIPAPILCLEGHMFSSESIWSSDQPMAPLHDNHVVCNGRSNPAWYRAAKIQGWDTVEWPHATKPPISGLHEVVKPLATRCTCFPDVARMGRYGRWTKGVLSDSAFYDTAELLKVQQGVLF